jgi:hypothetical protein
MHSYLEWLGETEPCHRLSTFTPAWVLAAEDGRVNYRLHMGFGAHLSIVTVHLA